MGSQLRPVYGTDLVGVVVFLRMRVWLKQDSDKEGIAAILTASKWLLDEHGFL